MNSPNRHPETPRPLDPDDPLDLNLPDPHTCYHPDATAGMRPEAILEAMGKHSREVMQFLPPDYQDDPARTPSGEQFRLID
jgi:hypothetical protein